jgi:hypothetical protein
MADLKQPLPPASAPATGPGGLPTVGQRMWQQQAHDLLAQLNGILSSNVFDWPQITENGHRVLTVAGGQQITGGFTEAEFDNGTPANGATVTINPSNGLKQKITNNVAGFTIAATAEVGDVELRIINGASAGTITFSSFSKQWIGDALDTTNAHQFLAFIYGYGSKTAYIVKALQ